MQAYGLAGRWEDALSLLSRAAVAAEGLEETGEEEAGGAVVPDERMYCSVINAMGESGAWEEAVALLQSMRRSPSSQLLAGAAGGNSDDKDKDTSVTAVPPSLLQTPRPGPAAYAGACRACAKQGEWSAVLGLIENMREDGVSRDAAVYASAMRAFVEAGEWERAVEIVTAEVRRAGLFGGGGGGEGGGGFLEMRHLASRSRQRLFVLVSCLRHGSRRCMPPRVVQQAFVLCWCRQISTVKAAACEAGR